MGRRREFKWKRILARRATLAAVLLLLIPVFPSAAQRDQPGAEAGNGAISDSEFEQLLADLADKASVYETIALRFLCIEIIRSSADSKERRYDYMYVEAEAQRYKPYRQKHTGRPGGGDREVNLEMAFPDSYSWTLMFARERQHLFRFKYVGSEWFSLRLAHILEFTGPLPFTSGATIYEWSGRVWVDAENYNFLRVEAEPSNQTERLKMELASYRQAPRFLIFPMGKKPHGANYSITFLNEYQRLSLPDEAAYRSFSLDLSGKEELQEVRTLRYTGYRFFDVDVKDKFLR